MKCIKLTLLGCAILSALAGCGRFDGKKSSAKAQHMVISENQTIKLNLSEDPQTLDPRKARGLDSVPVVRLLFEGLTYVDEKGNAQAAIADTIDVSPDLRTYTFHLKDCKWSNGDPLTASDFEYSWKTVLNPSFGSPNAYQLFLIKNAKSAYEGLCSYDDVGIQAIDAHTLVVTLQNPTPYFLKMTAFHPFFPVNQKWDQEHPSWTENGNPICISNGPFKLDSWKHSTELQLSKNASYWDANQIVLDTVICSILDDNLAYTLFEKGQIDWIGSPAAILPPDVLPVLKNNGSLIIKEAAGTQFIRVNTGHAPLDQPKFRNALNLAINRQEIVDHILQGNQKVALEFVPLDLGLNQHEFFKDHNVVAAQELFEEALSEAGITKDTLPTIKLSYVNSERLHKIAQAIQQNWRNNLGIDVQLDTCESKLFYDKLLNKNYQLALGSWFADYFDPISYLSVFQYKDNGTNNTQWSNPAYTQCLEESAFESDPHKRMQDLDKAQAILMQEMPILPIFHFAFNYVKSDQLQGAELSPLGYIELRKACRMRDANDYAQHNPLSEKIQPVAVADDSDASSGGDNDSDEDDNEESMVQDSDTTSDSEDSSPNDKEEDSED